MHLTVLGLSFTTGKTFQCPQHRAMHLTNTIVDAINQVCVSMPSTSGDASDTTPDPQHRPCQVSMPSTSGDASDFTRLGIAYQSDGVSMPSTSGDASDPTTRKSQQRKAFNSRFRARLLFLSYRTSLGLYRHEKTMSELGKE